MQKNIVRTDQLKGRRGRLPSKAKFPINIASNSPSIEFIRPLLERLVKHYPTLKVIEFFSFQQFSFKAIELRNENP